MTTLLPSTLLLLPKTTAAPPAVILWYGIFMCSTRAQHVMSSLLFPLWSDRSLCGCTCQPQTILCCYAFLVAHANRLTSAENPHTDLCSLHHISILLHSPSSPPMPTFPTKSRQRTRNVRRRMYRCVLHI